MTRYQVGGREGEDQGRRGLNIQAATWGPGRGSAVERRLRLRLLLFRRPFPLCSGKRFLFIHMHAWGRNGVTGVTGLECKTIWREAVLFVKRFQEKYTGGTVSSS